MEKRMKRKVAAGAAALLAVAGGGAAIAATQLSPKQESQAVLNDAASQLGVSPSELSAAIKSALEKRIDAAVAAGRISAAQGDEMKQRIESGHVPLFGFGPGPGDFEHHEMFGGLDAASTYLGLSEDELHSAARERQEPRRHRQVEGQERRWPRQRDSRRREEAPRRGVSAGDLTQAQATRCSPTSSKASAHGRRRRRRHARPAFGFRHDFERILHDRRCR